MKPEEFQFFPAYRPNRGNKISKQGKIDITDNGKREVNERRSQFWTIIHAAPELAERRRPAERLEDGFTFFETVLFLRNNYKIGYDFDCLLRRRVLFCETLRVGGWGMGGGGSPSRLGIER